MATAPFPLTDKKLVSKNTLDTELGKKIDKEQLNVAKPTAKGSVDFKDAVGGEAGIRFTTTNGYLRDNGSLVAWVRDDGTPEDLFWCDNVGVFMTKGDSGSDSDESIKTNWREIDTDQLIADLAKVLHGIYDRTDIKLTQVGASANQMERVTGMQNAVRTNENGIKSLAYGQAALVAAIKLSIRSEQQRETIAQQNQTITDLFQIVKDLQERVTALEGK